jgi:hypothetical protein
MELAILQMVLDRRRHGRGIATDHRLSNGAVFGATALARALG